MQTTVSASAIAVRRHAGEIGGSVGGTTLLPRGARCRTRAACRDTWRRATTGIAE